MTEHDPEKMNVAPGQPHDSMLSETVSYVVGLGLALVRNFVRLMGGDVKLVSAVGQGSTFSVRLPVASSVAPSSPG